MFRYYLTLVIGVLVILSNDPACAKNNRGHTPANDETECPVDAKGHPDPSCSHVSPGLANVSCPPQLDEVDCDYFKRGYDDALEDQKIMRETEKGMWKNDTGDMPAYKQGYDAGWSKKNGIKPK